ncbi:CAP domain-containing protein [Leptolyngbya sp. FACHB-16]|nr:CAP domain-containing protein [Leptolyngbya sp. FACHB-8]MBD2154575.1 CAP domain-containing protein [Leptolyngbya sp. FACHB-16]
MSTFLSEVLNLTNQFRQQNGLPALTYNARLGSAAQGHSQKMALQDFFNHVGLDGSEPEDRVSATGYQWSAVAENIAAGQRTPQDVVQGWIGSDGHRANMLDPNVTEIGLGYYFLANDTGSVNPNTYWTQVFARPS